MSLNLVKKVAVIGLAIFGSGVDAQTTNNTQSPATLAPFFSGSLNATDAIITTVNITQTNTDVVTGDVTLTQTITECSLGTCDTRVVTPVLTTPLETAVQCIGGVCNEVVYPCNICELVTGVKSYTETFGGHTITVASPYAAITTAGWVPETAGRVLAVAPSSSQDIINAASPESAKGDKDGVVAAPFAGGDVAQANDASIARAQIALTILMCIAVLM